MRWKKNLSLYLEKMAEISTQFGRILVGGHEGKLRTFDPLISALFRPAGERNMRGVFLFLKSTWKYQREKNSPDKS